MRRADQLGLSSSDQHLFGASNDCTVHDPLIKAHYKVSKGAELMRYPRCFESRDQAAIHAKFAAMFAANPASFKSSTELEALRARQEQRPSLFGAAPAAASAPAAAAASASAAAAPAPALADNSHVDYLDEDEENELRAEARSVAAFNAMHVADPDEDEFEMMDKPDSDDFAYDDE